MQNDFGLGIDAGISNDDTPAEPSLYDRLVPSDEELALADGKPAPAPIDEPSVDDVVPSVDDVPVDEPLGDPVDDTVVDDDVEDDPGPKEMYTPEQIKELLTSDGFDSIDTSRLTEEGQLIMRSMQSGLTPKLQEAADIRNELREIKEAFEAAKPKKQPANIFEAYDEDPDGVTTWVNSKINQLIESQAPVHEIEKIREVREQLRDHREKKILSANKQSTEQAQVLAQLKQAVPDIETKHAALRDFAVDMLGYDLQTLEKETHIGNRGVEAVKAIARINKAYERFNAAASAKTKLKRKQPTAVEKPGQGFEKKDTTFNDRLSEAKKTGNFSDLILNLREE